MNRYAIPPAPQALVRLAPTLPQYTQDYFSPAFHIDGELCPPAGTGGFGAPRPLELVLAAATDLTWQPADPDGEPGRLQRPGVGRCCHAGTGVERPERAARATARRRAGGASTLQPPARLVGAVRRVGALSRATRIPSALRRTAVPAAPEVTAAASGVNLASRMVARPRGTRAAANRCRTRPPPRSHERGSALASSRTAPVGTDSIMVIRVSPRGRSGPHRGPRYRAGRSPAERLLRPYRGAYRDRPKLHRWCTPVHPRQYPRHRFPGRLHRHALRCTRQYLAFEGTGLLGREAEAPLKRGRGARRDVRDVASWPLLGREAEAPLKPWHARVPRCAYVSSPRQRSRGPVEAS
jgi:hypothetical protein